MGYDYEDAWNELKGIFHASKPNEETEAPLGEKAKEWMRNKMSDMEKEISNV